MISHIGVHGIKELDVFCIFSYPWIMCLLFVVSGVSSKYALCNKTYKEFIKDRTKRILIPSIIGIFAYGWISGLVTNYYADIFASNGNTTPGIIKYIIFSLIGIGALWYAHVLYVASLLIVIIRKLDPKQNLEKIFKKVNIPILIGVCFIVWGASFILNVPVISVYRFGIYLLMFLLGYYVFSNDEIITKLERMSIPLGIITLIMGISFSIVFYGSNFGSDEFLRNIFTNIYLFMVCNFISIWIV